MTSQNWRLKKLIRINMRDYHFYNLKMLYSGYLKWQYDQIFSLRFFLQK